MLDEDIYWEDVRDKTNVLACVIIYYNVSMDFYYFFRFTFSFFFPPLFVVVYVFVKYKLGPTNARPPGEDTVMG